MSEADKVEEHQVEASAIAEFIEWLESQGVKLCKMQPQYRDDNLFLGYSLWELYGKSIENLIYEFFGIDGKKYEQEKRQIIAQLAMLNKPQKPLNS